MANHQLLDNVTHKDLKVDRKYGADQSDDVSLARAFPVELGVLQNEYPLFFHKNSGDEHFQTIALFGFTDRENLYLGEAGWEADSIPLTIQRQPFLIGFQEQEVDGALTEVPVVHIDVDHPSVNTSEGEDVFLPQGGESPLLEKTSSILMAIHEGHAASKAFSQLLVGLELLESVSIDMEFIDGSRHRLEGLHTINEERLRDLNGSALEALHRQGHLRSVYMMSASMPNLSRLIQRKNRRLASEDR